MLLLLLLQSVVLHHVRELNSIDSTYFTLLNNNNLEILFLKSAVVAVCIDSAMRVNRCRIFDCYK